MNWFFIAIFGPFFWSLTNHLDKYLLSKHLEGIGKGALILYSTFFGVVVLPIIVFLRVPIFSVDMRSIVTLIVAGVLSAVALFLYLYALEEDEASIVVPFFQTIPIFGIILGYALLGELITNHQILGSIVIVIAGIILSIEIESTSGFAMKKKVPLLMLLSSFCFALYEVLFKIGSLDVGFLIGSFWQYCGLLLFGIVLYVSIPQYRLDFRNLIKRHTPSFFGLNIVNESLTVIGNSFYNFALLLVPVGLVMSTTAYQPLFVFIIGSFLALYYPNLQTEKISLRHLTQKILAIVLILIGTYILFI